MGGGLDPSLRLRAEEGDGVIWSEIAFEVLQALVWFGLGALLHPFWVTW